MPQLRYEKGGPAFFVHQLLTKIDKTRRDKAFLVMESCTPEMEIEESQSLLANNSDRDENDGIIREHSTVLIETESESIISPSQSLLVDLPEYTNNQSREDKDNEIKSDDDETQFSESEIVPEFSREVMEQEKISEVEEMEEIDDEEEEDEISTATNLPLGRVKKIMKICLATNETEETHPEVTNKSKKKKKGKGSKPNPNTGSKIILSAEAVFLTTVATELFVAAVTQQTGRITASTKKKTMTMEHLKRALSDNECFEFLQGCFQPSLLIGD